ncbi:sarcosine oxidase subunit gamma [Burkholderia sp. PAMC 26561]|uniref:sarcosine oxidase subunit gamma n=1 Tax=Burkholderia sp. PAMC 26561 TaxID=1795043 RepID=UPI00076AFBB6|nr:sarcosine oxidase subunit gamma [Burkholderia sp. PAMC 26561]AME26128.1 sarcosine oxidase subunit gamma [Burkholderia sp. PAMC 26561]
MWNENGSNQTVVDRAIGQGVWQESPLVGTDGLLKKHLAAGSKAFRLVERPFLELVNLRGDLRDAAFVAAVESVLGCKPPEEANTTATGNGYDLLWLGPDEWLVRSVASHSATQAAPMEAKLRNAFRGLFAAAVDIGSGYTVLEISGARTRDVLARGCPLDLHPRLFGAGQCAQSHYFKASVTIVPTGDDSFDLVIRRSFADYFVKIMLDAAEPLLS